MNESYRVAEQYLEKAWNNLPLWCPIMGSHVRRLGFLRVFIGAVGMYLSIPVFMLVHTFVVTLALRYIIHPFLNMGDVQTQNFIIMDRYKVKGLSAVDTFNCLFCGWANGMCTLINRSVDRISENPQKINLFYQFIVATLCAIYTIPALVIQTIFFYIYNYLIATPLKLEKVYYEEIIQKYFVDSDYASVHGSWTKGFLRYQKVTWSALGQALRQIESAWCPIKHFERSEDVVYPDHHKLFFEPDQIDELRYFLRNHKTVLERKNV
ncbi:MAG: hypothetical protein ABII18_04460 [bacterium]